MHWRALYQQQGARTGKTLGSKCQFQGAVSIIGRGGEIGDVVSVSVKQKSREVFYE